MLKSLPRFVALSFVTAIASLMFMMPARAQALVAISNEIHPVSFTVKPRSTTALVTLTGFEHDILMVSWTPTGHNLAHYLNQVEVSGVSSAGVQYHGSKINAGVVTLQDDLLRIQGLLGKDAN